MDALKLPHSVHMYVENAFLITYHFLLVRDPKVNSFFGPLHVKALIEDVYAKCNNTRVTIISPSYGPQVTLGFLTRMTQTWKDKYVSLFVALSPVW